MTIEYFYEPWFHFVIDDFLSENELSEFVRIIDEVSQSDYKLVTYGEHDIPFSHTYVFDNTVRRFLRKKMVDTYEQLEMKPKIDLQNVFYNTQMSTLYPNSNHGIHWDMGVKLMSLVVYMSEEGNGTRLYNTDKLSSFSKEVEWKINRCVGFFPKEDITWHDFYNNTDHDRNTLVLNLTSEKI